MTTDTSSNFLETERFLDRRLSELRGVGEVTGAATEWLSYAGKTAINVARSKSVWV